MRKLFLLTLIITSIALGGGFIHHPSGGGGESGGTWGSITGTLSSQTDLNTALGGKEATANKGAANGYAPLDVDSKVPSANLPAGLPSVAAWGEITGKPEKSLTDYAGANGLAKLNAALTAIGTSNPTRLCIDTSVTLTANLDLTAYANIEFYIVPNCPISYDSSVYTLTIGGTIVDCLHKIFNDTAATPNYTKGVKLVGRMDWVRPDWWGMQSANTHNDATAAAINVKGIRSAIQSVPTSVVVQFSTGYFPINEQITLPQRVALKGAGSARVAWTTTLDTCIANTDTFSGSLFYGVDGTANGLSVRNILFEVFGTADHIFNIGHATNSGVHYFEFFDCIMHGDDNWYNDDSHYHIYAKNAHQGVISNLRMTGRGSKIYDAMDSWIGGGMEITGGGPETTTIGIYLNGSLLSDTIIFGLGTGIYVNGEGIISNTRVDQCGIDITGAYGYVLRGTNVRLTEGYKYCLQTNSSLVKLVNSAIEQFYTRTFTEENIVSVTVGTTNTETHTNTLTLGSLNWRDLYLGAGSKIKLGGAANGGNNCNLYIVSANGPVATVYDYGGTMVAETLTTPVITCERRGISLDAFSEGSINNTDFIESTNAGATTFRAIEFDIHHSHTPKCPVIQENPGLDLPQDVTFYKDFQTPQTYYNLPITATFKRKKTDGTTAGDIYSDITVVSTGDFVADGVKVGDYNHVRITAAGWDPYWFYGRVSSVSATTITYEAISDYNPSEPNFSYAGVAMTIEKFIAPWLKQHLTTPGTYNVSYLPVPSEGRKRNLMVESGITLKQWATPFDAATNVNGTITAITGAFNAFTTSPNVVTGDGFMIASYSPLCALKLNLTSGASGVTYKWQYYGYNAAWKDFPTGAVTNATGLNSTGEQIIHFKVPADAFKDSAYGNGGTSRAKLYLIRCYATAGGGGGGACSAAPEISCLQLNGDSPPITAGQMAVVGLEDRYGVPVETARGGDSGPTYLALGNSGASKTINFTSAPIQSVTISADTTLTFSFPKAGTYILRMTNGGAHTITGLSSTYFNWKGTGTAEPPAFSSSGTDIITFISYGTGLPDAAVSLGP